MHGGRVVHPASLGADEHAQTALLEDVDIVVVGVAHGPATVVSPRLLGLFRVDILAVAVRPVHVRLRLRQL